MTKNSSFESLRIFCKSHVIFTFTYETEAHIHLCKKASPGGGRGRGEWRGSQQQRLGLRPPWKHRPSQQVAVLGPDLNLFWKKELKKVTVNQQKIINVCLYLCGLGLTVAAPGSPQGKARLGGNGVPRAGEEPEGWMRPCPTPASLVRHPLAPS